jgi:hypothetical protein
VQQKRIFVPDIPAKPVAKANDEAIKKLKEIGAVVEPVAQNTNYLAANFVTVTNPGDKEVKMLLPLKRAVDRIETWQLSYYRFCVTGHCAI